MSDLLYVLPHFDTRPYTHLLPSLDKALITTNDLVTLEPHDVAKRAQLPAADVRRLVDQIVGALHRHLGCGGGEQASTAFLSAVRDTVGGISTLDTQLDAALSGGFRPGYLVEITGESGAGKTQLLLTLLLASQLPPPQGLAKSAIYISTEAPLATPRLAQLLSTHPALASLPLHERPSLSRILSIQTPDLESQEHILRYQLPVAIKKHNVGLVVLDSVAANYRAEFEKQGARNGAAASMARRGAQLVQLGALLRDLAHREGLAVVVANQVADRFARPSNPPSHAVSRTTSGNSQGNSQSAKPPTEAEDGLVLSPDPLALDHQQCWFTGWGDIQSDPLHSLKTPSLGLVWSNQISCRIALIKKPVFAGRPLVVTANGEDQWNDDENHISKWRRWLKVVFAPWAPSSEGRGVEYEVLKTGISHVSRKEK
ncbi:DNA repair protein-like protein RAD57 [Massarina eburnea CBS 473.64]|uniref:DNA repair protein-like protein RAD57 n=1 Tax=Massarina eburnea CBS 473.64 TaxID=1395130 RepID=A0A6A6S300_9PLEO|nr:DNA repair protein-like protein RAD57 [Massarina eburnea CBS 473.64]